MECESNGLIKTYVLSILLLLLLWSGLPFHSFEVSKTDLSIKAFIIVEKNHIGVLQSSKKKPTLLEEAKRGLIGNVTFFLWKSRTPNLFQSFYIPYRSIINVSLTNIISTTHITRKRLLGSVSKRYS